MQEDDMRFLLITVLLIWGLNSKISILRSLLAIQARNKEQKNPKGECLGFIDIVNPSHHKW